MKKVCCIILGLLNILHAQEIEFNVSVNNDTLLLGNYLEVKFEIKNGNGTFQAPDFSGWSIVSGPNTASSYSYMNGQVNQSSSYTYYLEAPSDGIFEVGVAKLKTEDIELKTPSLKIVVYQNPEGVRQHPKFKSDERINLPEPIQKEDLKKKRKATKI
ncbi:MAG: BatD family protein [Saprospiraceae bacterium]|nr:BatD family protein [Saprospiraceae bacterium]